MVAAGCTDPDRDHGYTPREVKLGPNEAGIETVMLTPAVSFDHATTVLDWHDVPGAAAYEVEHHERYAHTGSRYFCLVKQGTEECADPARVEDSTYRYSQPHSMHCRYRIRTVWADGDVSGWTGWVMVRAY